MYNLNKAYEESFFKANYKDSWPLASFIAPKLKEYFKLEKVLDLGCATGHYLKAFGDCEVEAFGVEGSEGARNSLVCDPRRVEFLDLRHKLKASLDKFKMSTSPVDMVMSIEVAEHIEEKYADDYIYNMTYTEPKYIYMTAALPKQGGHFHVNCQPQEYWVEKLSNQGYIHRPRHKEEINKWLKARCNCYFVRDHDNSNCKGQFVPNWFPRNLMVFEVKKNAK